MSDKTGTLIALAILLHAVASAWLGRYQVVPVAPNSAVAIRIDSMTGKAWYSGAGGASGAASLGRSTSKISGQTLHCARTPSGGTLAGSIGKDVSQDGQETVMVMIARLLL